VLEYHYTQVHVVLVFIFSFTALLSLIFSTLFWPLELLSHSTHFTVHRFICVFCVFVWYCICVVLLWERWGGPDGIKAYSLESIFFQCFDTVVWVIW